MIKYGIIGAGWRSELYLRIAALMPDTFKVSGIYIRNKQKREEFSQKYNVKILASLEELLKTKGIEDINRIKFENEDGEIEEVSWDSLSNRDRLNIINSSSDNSNELQDQEIYLINAIRESKLSPAEYI